MDDKIPELNKYSFSRCFCHAILFWKWTRNMSYTMHRPLHPFKSLLIPLKQTQLSWSQTVLMPSNLIWQDGNESSHWSMAPPLCNCIKTTVWQNHAVLINWTQCGDMFIAMQEGHIGANTLCCPPPELVSGNGAVPYVVLGSLSDVISSAVPNFRK